MTVKAAGYVIFRKASTSKECEYLLLQASYGEYHWSPPKGHVDPGEKEAETALREVEEETGIRKEDLSIVEGFEKTVNYSANGKPKSVVYWMAELKSPHKEIKLSKEHKAFNWYPMEQACEISKYETTKELLKACHKFITFNM